MPGSFLSLPREAVCRRTRCLFSLPCEAVGRVAHRERSEPMCRVGGVSGSEVFAHLRALPPPGASRHPPHKWEGQERKSFALSCCRFDGRLVKLIPASVRTQQG
jgi:hypothetical protein